MHAFVGEVNIEHMGMVFSELTRSLGMQGRSFRDKDENRQTFRTEKSLYFESINTGTNSYTSPSGTRDVKPG